MKKKQKQRKRCEGCGGKPTYEIGDTVVCRECLRESVFTYAPEPTDVVEAIERVARIGALHSTSGLLALMRSADSDQKMLDVVGRVADNFVPSETADVRPDAIVADELLEELDERDYGLHYWWIGLDTVALAKAVLLAEAGSVLELLDAAGRNDAVRTLLDDSIRFPLFGATVSYEEAIAGGLGARLAMVSAEDFALGMARVVELGDAIKSGAPVSASHGVEERDLFLALNSDVLRRAEAGWTDTKAFLETLTERVDRRERLVGIWLLHPVSGPLAEYLSILHALHVDGHHAGAVAFCRSLVESGINRLTDPGLMTQRPTMEEKLNTLERRGLLSKEGRRNAKDVWWRGNKVLHSDPALLTDSLATIELAIQVLSEISPSLPRAPLDPAAAALLAEMEGGSL